MKALGTVHKYGANIDTDVIIPARYLNTSDPAELARHCLEDLDTAFVDKVTPGDIIVAEENFGCGSSREHAPIAIKAAGVDVVIALNIESSRITESNNVNRVPTISVPVFDTQATLGTENAASDWDGTAANMADIQTGAQIQTAYVDGDIASIASTPWTDKKIGRAHV